MTILYIDDDADDRQFFSEAARNLDSAVLIYTAKDGAEGLKALRELVVMPDFIFLDMNMPVMNGEQFLSEVKKEVRLRSIPVVIYSTTTPPAEAIGYKKLGAYRVVAKPTSMAGIARVIGSVIQQEIPESDAKIRIG